MSEDIFDCLYRGGGAMIQGSPSPLKKAKISGADVRERDKMSLDARSLNTMSLTPCSVGTQTLKIALLV